MASDQSLSSEETSYSGNSFGEFLLIQFNIRKEKNPKFSMRSFALKLGVDQSLISKVLSGKRDLSYLSMKNCLVRMEIPEEQIEDLLSKFSKKVIYHRSVDEDVFSVISHWAHFAILELFKITGFDLNLNEIADRLNLTPTLVEECLSRLERFGFLESENGKLVVSRPNNTWASQTATSAARRQLQKSFLEKSIHALETLPIDKRHHGSYTFAIDSSRLPELKEKIADMNIQVAQMSSLHQNLDQVYQFTVSLYPLTQLKDEI